ncbi:Fc.00g054740.m01.CDS01 [Cosmosporella sp. VM-42]
MQHAPDAETRHSPDHPVAPPSVESESRLSASKAQVIQGPGRSKFVDNILWARMVEEFHDPEDALGDSSDDLEASDDDFGFVLSNHPRPNTKLRHPPLEGIRQLWQIFVENIDPLTKVIHVPTLRSAIEKAARDIEAIPRTFEALMFAIYSAAVMSMTDDDCKQKLFEPRKVLLSRYISATKVALSRAKFMGTTSLVILQALVIHLIAVRDVYEPRVVWSLTGVAVRIAQGMGLERDGVHLSVPPFETEMRRRIWWQLKMHDFRTAELCGVGKFQDLHTGAECTNWPTSINDDQLHPGMTSLMPETNKLTDVVFVSLKCELLNFAASRVTNLRRQGKTSSPWDPQTPGGDTDGIDESFKEIEDLLETKYLRYCDPSQPLHLMAMLMARCSINIVRFMSHHPRRWASIEATPLPERQWVWEICIKLLEQHNMLQSNPQLKQFAWHAPYFQQWHAIIYVLDTLRADPLNADAEKAWKHIGSTYRNNPDLVFDMRKPIHVAVGGLCLKAYLNREAALQNGTIRPPPIPDFIVQLRQQLEAVKTRREERYAKSSQSKDRVSDSQANSFSNAPIPRPTSENAINNLSDALDSTCLKQSTTSLPPPGLTPGGITGSPERDLFRSIYWFDDGQIGDINDASLHLRFMPDQDCDMENSATQTITWDQWDSWLADSNVILPLSSKEDFTQGI